MQPSNFIASTDYGSIKNDSNGINISLTIPAGTTIYSSGGSLIAKWGETTISAGSSKGLLRPLMWSNKNSARCSGTTLYFTANTTTSYAGQSSTSNTGMEGFIARLSSDTISLAIWGESSSAPDGLSITLNETITVYATISTFLSPLI